MIKFTKKLAITAGLLALCSGQFVAFGSNPDPLYTDIQANQCRLDFKETAMVAHDKNILKYIFTLAAADPATNPGNFRHVCKELKNIIDGLIDKNDKDRKYADQHPIWQKIIMVSYGGLGHDAIWNSFLNGALVYKPNQTEGDYTNGTSFPIRRLLNPSEGTFDLSQCGDAGKYLSIRTGLRPGINQANAGKAEIFIIPYFMAKRFCDTPRGSYLKPIMAAWNGEVAPLGIFYHWWADGNEHYVYCTWAGTGALSVNNLRVIYLDEKSVWGVRAAAWRAAVRCVLRRFHVSFLNPPRDY